MSVLKRGTWSAEEDQRLLELIDSMQPLKWVNVAAQMGSRTSKQCRERYHNYLKPSLSRTPITPEEGRKLEELVRKYGKRWAEISRHLPGRSDNAIKNWWNASAQRRRTSAEISILPSTLSPHMSPQHMERQQYAQSQPSDHTRPSVYHTQRHSSSGSSSGHSSATTTAASIMANSSAHGSVSGHGSTSSSGGPVISSVDTAGSLITPPVLPEPSRGRQLSQGLIPVPNTSVDGTIAQHQWHTPPPPPPPPPQHSSAVSLPTQPNGSMLAGGIPVGHALFKQAYLEPPASPRHLSVGSIAFLPQDASQKPVPIPVQVSAPNGVSYTVFDHSAQPNLQESSSNPANQQMPLQPTNYIGSRAGSLSAGPGEQLSFRRSSVESIHTDLSQYSLNTSLTTSPGSRRGSAVDFPPSQPAPAPHFANTNTLYAPSSSGSVTYSKPASLQRVSIANLTEDV